MLGSGICPILTARFADAMARRHRNCVPRQGPPIDRRGLAAHFQRRAAMLAAAKRSRVVASSAICWEASMKFLLGLIMAVATTAATAQVGTSKAPPAGFPAAVARPPVPLAIQDAIIKAADDLLNQVANQGQPIEIVIDPLIDGITGAETAETRSIGRRVSEIAGARHPHVKVLPFTRD